MKNEKLTHAELEVIAERWLKKRCGATGIEVKSFNDSGEIPDVIGFNSHGSFVIEAKTSYGDFIADRKKPFRINPEQGVGDWRFFIAEKGVLDEAYIPKAWGLITVEGGKITKVHNPYGKGNIYSLWTRNVKNNEAERCMMYTLLLRKNK